MSLVESNNHFVLVKEDGSYVIDTGCPCSLRGMLYQPIQEQINNLVGMRIDGIIGLDEILRNGITIDRTKKEVRFETETLANSFPIRMGGFNRIYTDSFTVNGNRINNMIVDSGAQITYLNESVVTTLNLASDSNTFEDFNPLVGNFISNTYNVDKSINGIELSSNRIACMNNSIATALSADNDSGIFGLFDLYCHKICITRDKIYFE